MPDWCIGPADLEAVLARAIEDRANQFRGGEPGYVPLVNDKGEHVLLFKYLADLTDEQKAHLPAWVESAKKRAPLFKDRITVQSLYRHAKWKPMHIFSNIAPTPVMILTPEKDEIVSPALQREIFESIQSKQKRHEIVKDKGHANFLADVKLDKVLGGQLDFLKEVLKF
jgi:alpha-beta hydrolase superfamily lysophospholipase